MSNVSEEDRSAWLAENLMGWHKVMLGYDLNLYLGVEPVAWWGRAADDAVGIYTVEAGTDHDVRDWNPFEDIRQAKEVQAAMIERGWWWRGAHARFGHESRFIGEGGRFGNAYADTEAAAICLAAGRALGWPFEEDA